jgi:hypothetical protein
VVATLRSEGSFAMEPTAAVAYDKGPTSAGRVLSSGGGEKKL